jgi:hypothetical protein
MEAFEHAILLKPKHCPKTLPSASSTNSWFRYRQYMRARLISKEGQKALRILDNMIAVAVYVAVAGVVLRGLYQFVQKAVSR